MTTTDHITKTFKYKIRPNRRFVEACERTLDQSRFVWNCALEQRVSQFLKTGKSPSFYEQQRQLTEARAALPEVRACLRRVQEDALERLDFAFKSFYQRLRQKPKAANAGFPRFKTQVRYRTFSQRLERERRCPLDGDKLIVPGVGSCRVRLSRPIEGKVKMVRITQRASGWYALLVCYIPRPAPLPKTHLSVGVDVGISHFATLNTGEQISNPRHAVRSERRLKRLQRRFARKKKGSNNRATEKRKLMARYEHVANQRRDFHHKVAHDLVQRFDVIAVEALGLSGMLTNRSLRKAIFDVAWGRFFIIAERKAEDAGRRFERKASRYTSQTCSRCGHRQEMPLSIRVFTCESCGCTLDRDHNAAINIDRGAVKSKPVERDGVLRSRNRHGKYRLSPDANSHDSLP